MHNEQILQQLRQGVEEAIDTKMRTPKDFDTLSERIYQMTHKRVSSSTLKRFWGYLSSVSVPRLSTLDILAQFIGYADYESFCHTCEEDHLVQEPVELPPTASTATASPFLVSTVWTSPIPMFIILRGSMWLMQSTSTVSTILRNFATDVFAQLTQ